MNIFRAIRNYFKPLPMLRNRPGGMAWIRGLDHGNGVEVLNGRAVKTVRRISDGKWAIDPVQKFQCTRNTFYTGPGVLIVADREAFVDAIHDDCLEPWRDTGITDSEVTELYRPAPAKEKERAEKVLENRWGGSVSRAGSAKA